MNKIKFVFIVILAMLNLSFSMSDRIGMLTDDYGIVVKADLDEEEARCSNVEPFPSDNACFNYWQCLPTREIYIDCEDIGDVGDSKHTGQANFWIKEGNNIHHYLTRRNFDIEACHEWVNEWKSVINGEDVVCLSGNFIDMSEQDESSFSPIGIHYYWIIDRIKSRHGEWSYFYRGDTESKELASAVHEHRTPNISAPDRVNLLSQDDMALEENDYRSGPALLSSSEVEERWESYNKWLCFDKDVISVTHVEIKYEGKIKSMPQINAWTPEHFLEISLSAETEDDNDQIFSKWMHLIEKANQVCIYAAHLQRLPSLENTQSSLWVISKLKTESGYWSK